eukprot:3204272-Prymnesium_polylepis.1
MPLSDRDRTEIVPRSTRDRWPNLVELPQKLLVGRRNFLRPSDRNCYVTDPPRTTDVSIRLRSIESPYPQRSIMHAELATAP